MVWSASGQVEKSVQGELVPATPAKPESVSGRLIVTRSGGLARPVPRALRTASLAVQRRKKSRSWSFAGLPAGQPVQFLGAATVGGKRVPVWQGTDALKVYADRNPAGQPDEDVILAVGNVELQPVGRTQRWFAVVVGDEVEALRVACEVMSEQVSQQAASVHLAQPVCCEHPAGGAGTLAGIGEPFDRLPQGFVANRERQQPEMEVVS